MREFWVWYEKSKYYTDSETQKLLTACAELAGGEAAVCAVAVCPKPPTESEIRGADMIRWCKADGSSTVKAELLAEMAREYKPSVILFTAGITASHTAARTAALLDTGLSADCTGLSIKNGFLIMHRFAFGGGIEADIICRNGRPQMATVRPGAFKNYAEAVKKPVLQKYEPKFIYEDPVAVLSRNIARLDRKINEAGIIVSGGRGVGSKADFALLEELAQVMGGELGASRAAVDAGFAPWSSQVGQTGSNVKPGLYLAFGISGSIQHIAGMHGSGYVVAVNIDAKAPIFDYSDLAVTADWKMAAEYLLKEFKGQKLVSKKQLS